MRYAIIEDDAFNMKIERVKCADATGRCGDDLYRVNNMHIIHEGSMFDTEEEAKVALQKRAASPGRERAIRSRIEREMKDVRKLEDRLAENLVAQQEAGRET